MFDTTDRRRYNGGINQMTRQLAMKALQIITAEFFEQATGRAPKNDDLERCNCEQAGEMGHQFCGWNYRKNVPSFQNCYDDPAYLVSCKGDGTGAIYSGADALEKAKRYQAQQNKQDPKNTYLILDY